MVLLAWVVQSKVWASRIRTDFLLLQLCFNVRHFLDRARGSCREALPASLWLKGPIPQKIKAKLGILRQSIQLLAVPQFAMEPAIIILKFPIRSASKAWAHGAPCAQGPIGPCWPMGPHGTCQHIINSDVRSLHLRLKTVIFIMFPEPAQWSP